MKNKLNYNFVSRNDFNIDPIMVLSGHFLYTKGKKVYDISSRFPFSEETLDKFYQITSPEEEVSWCKETKASDIGFSDYLDRNILVLGSIAAILNPKLKSPLEKLNIFYKLWIADSKILTKISKNVDFTWNELWEQIYIDIIVEYREPLDHYTIQTILCLFYGFGITEIKGKGLAKGNNNKFLPVEETEVNSIKIKNNHFQNSNNPIRQFPLFSIFESEKYVEKSYNHKKTSYSIKNKDLNQSSTEKFVYVKPKYNFWTKYRENPEFGGIRGNRKESSLSNIYFDNKLLGINSSVPGGFAQGISFLLSKDENEKAKENLISKTFYIEPKDNSSNFLVNAPQNAGYSSYLDFIIQEPEGLSENFKQNPLFANSVFLFNHFGFNEGGQYYDTDRAESSQIDSQELDTKKSYNYAEEILQKHTRAFDEKLPTTTFEDDFIQTINITYKKSQPTSILSKQKPIIGAETLGFVINKKSPTEEQSFFIPKLGADLNIVDTQTFWGDIYKISIDEIYGIVGTEIEYEKVAEKEIFPWEIVSADNKKTTFKIQHVFAVVSKPKINFMKEKIFDNKIKMFDKMPTAVDVDMAYYKDTSFLKIFFNDTIEKYSLKYEDYLLQLSYIDQFEGIEPVQQKKVLEDFKKYISYEEKGSELISFTTERDIRDYDCLLLNEDKSFNNKFTTIYPYRSLKICLEFNKKYYAILYCKDRHFKVSPLQIFKVEIINTSSSIYCEILPVSMEEFFNLFPQEEKEIEFSKNFVIQPSANSLFSYYKFYEDILQYVSNNNKYWATPSDDGEERTKIPQYKFRVMSKKTGRKLDLNVNFEREVLKFTGDIQEKLNSLQIGGWNKEKLTV